MKANLTSLQVLGIVPFGRKGGDFYALRLSHPGWQDWRPGQFMMLRPASFGLAHTWGRPFSICHMTTRHMICFFRVVGKGTALLAKVAPGDEILAWGPLGNGFAMEENTPTLLLAGGMGIAPFVGYVNRHPQPWNLHMLFGHREPLDCYPVDSINERITVDAMAEPTNGDLSVFLAALSEKIHECAAKSGVALCCGPTPFMRAVKKIAAAAACRLQVSLENRMACGVGACLGCVCKTIQSPLPKQVCLHGPVFWANDIEI